MGSHHSSFCAQNSSFTLHSNPEGKRARSQEGDRLPALGKDAELQGFCCLLLLPKLPVLHELHTQLPICVPVLSGRRGRPPNWAGPPRDSPKPRPRTLSAPEEQALSVCLPLCLQLTGAYRKNPSSPSWRVSWHPWAQLPAVMATGSASSPGDQGAQVQPRGRGSQWRHLGF